MRCVAAGVMVGWLMAVSPGTALAQDPPPGADAQKPVISGVRIEGASIFTPEQLQRRFGLEPGAHLKDTPDAIAADIRRRYAADGYTFAEVTASFDEARVLTVQIDEGQIDAIEFQGVDSGVAGRLLEEFAVRPGDVFNRPQAARALDEALQVGQGAIVRRQSQDTFTMIRDSGRHVLQVNLRTRSSHNGVFIGTQGREDWFSAVDGFNPAIGFQSTIFDATRFNHTYWSGYVSYKVAAERVGYSLGIERPFFTDGVLQVGGSIQDMTASDDFWRLREVEQSLVAFGFHNTFRDYYRRKGYQVNAAVRPFANHEWLLAWRDDEQLALVNDSEFSLFREDDHPYRSNVSSQEGDLRAVLLGYTFDSDGLTRESPGERYRRHQLDSLFGLFSDRDHGVRVEATFELASASFDQDFDFTRTVLNARGWSEVSPGRFVSGRVIGGFSSGALPPQRVFGLGGIGSVHGYAFKQGLGEGMLLFNGEFRQRFGRSGIRGLAFVDLGRVYRPIAGSTEEWLKGVGVGLEGGRMRLEFGWRLNDIPGSLQILFRLGPTF